MPYPELLAESEVAAQPASLAFFVPVAAAYVVACVGWLGLRRLRLVAPAEAEYRAKRPWVDLGLALAAAALIFLLGQAYRRGWLLPAGWIYWQLNNLIIFSPIAAVVVVRRQPWSTIYLTPPHVGRSVLVGLGLALASTVTYLGLRGTLSDLSTVWAGAIDKGNLSNLLPVILEGVALAFLFERLRWCMKLVPALLIPSVLFAIAHIPRQLESGLSPAGMAAFFVFNTALPMFILYVVSLSRDVIWLGVVHYIMDIAIRAFE